MIVYTPNRLMRWFNKLGDYSYGIYIYSFVIQQLIIFYMVGVNEVSLIFISTIASFFVAFISWHLLEKKALKYRHSLVLFSKKITDWK